MAIDEEVEELEKGQEEERDPVKDRYDELFNQKLSQYKVMSPHKLDDSSKKFFFRELKDDWQRHLNRIKEIPEKLAEEYEAPKAFEYRDAPNVATSSFKQEIVGLLSAVPTKSKSSKGSCAVDVEVSLPFGNGRTSSTEFFWSKKEAQSFLDMLKSKIASTSFNTKSLSNGNVAQSIVRQINAIDRRAMMAWGAKEVMSITDPVFDKKEEGTGIKFKVHGPLHKGYIIVLLTPHDTYDIFAFTIRKFEVKLKQSARHVFVENLVSAIDKIVG